MSCLLSGGGAGGGGEGLLPYIMRKKELRGPIFPRCEIEVNIRIKSHYSPRLKRIIVFVDELEVVSTKSERKLIKSTICLTDQKIRKLLLTEFSNMAMMAIHKFITSQTTA